MQGLEVYKSINAVMSALAKTGISKDHKNAQQGYKFRGIDDIYNTLATLLAENNLVICPTVKKREQLERTTIKGGVIFYTSVDIDYTVVSSKDGSCFTTSVCGEAMDSADKSTNKAMSAAYKYLCLQLFCIPTEGDNDADATTPPAVTPAQKAAQTKAENKADFEKRFKSMWDYMHKSDLSWSYDLDSKFSEMMNECSKRNYEKEKCDELVAIFEKLEKDSLPQF